MKDLVKIGPFGLGPASDAEQLLALAIEMQLTDSELLATRLDTVLHRSPAAD